MSVVTNSSPVVAGESALAEAYNDLRADLLLVEANSPPIGSGVIWFMPQATIPAGWALGGSEISRTTYAEAFALFGTTYGVGNGTSTFVLPDLTDMFPMFVGSDGDLGDEGGSATVDTTHTHTGGAHTHVVSGHNHTLSNHTHTLTAHTHDMSHDHNTSDAFAAAGGGLSVNTDVTAISASTGSGGGGVTGSGGGGNTGTNTDQDTSSAGAVATSSAGSATQENRPPFKSVYLIIKVL